MNFWYVLIIVIYYCCKTIYHVNFFILVITPKFRYFYLNLTVCCKISSGTWRSLSYCAFSLYPDTVWSVRMKTGKKCRECFVRFITCYVYHQLLRLLQCFDFEIDGMWEKWASSCTLSSPRDLSVACTDGRDVWSWWFPRQFWNRDRECDYCVSLRLFIISNTGYLFVLWKSLSDRYFQTGRFCIIHLFRF